MSYLSNLIDDTEKTHKNLGELMAITQIVVKARKLMMIVSPSGCGKSTVMNQIGKNTHDAIMPDKISIAGLAVMADRLNSFRSVIVVDDITTTQTDYARKTTITTLVALCYSHRIQTIMAGQEFEIVDFYGSSIIGVQPIILKSLMLLDEWDGSIQDKALRYYHMYRPLSPSIGQPTLNYKHGLDIDSVNDFEPDYENRYWRKLMDLGLSQWSRARAVEHMKDLLKAVSALENRPNVMPEDYEILAKLLKPMAVENIAVVKEELEGERFLNNTLLLLLVEYYTYGGKFTLAQLAEDYKITIQQVYKIMAQRENKEYWQQISKSPTIYRATTKLEEQLKMFDLHIKESENT